VHREVLGADAGGGHDRRTGVGTGCSPRRPAGEGAPVLSGRWHGLRDLTHPLTTSFPAFAPGEEAVRRTVVTIEADGYYMQEWRIIEHIGTHVDAPGHFTPGGP
jgi:hypothetical protein